MTIVRDRIAQTELEAIAKAQFGDLARAVVGVERGVMATDGELHSDEEALLLEGGSEQRHLWDINLYPGIAGEGWVEFDSMIDVRPSQGNRSRGVDDADTSKATVALGDHLVAR